MTTPRKKAKRQHTALAASKALDRANRAMHRYMTAARECGEFMEPDDSRIKLVSDMNEYAGWLFSVYNVPRGLE